MAASDAPTHPPETSIPSQSKNQSPACRRPVSPARHTSTHAAGAPCQTHHSHKDPRASPIAPQTRDHSSPPPCESAYSPAKSHPHPSPPPPPPPPSDPRNLPSASLACPAASRAHRPPASTKTSSLAQPSDAPGGSSKSPSRP